MTSVPVSNVVGYPLRDVDPTSNFLFSAFGSKGSGKTTWNRFWFDSFPLSKLHIDVNGEDEPGPDTMVITEPERAMPPPSEGRYPNVLYLPDPGSATYNDDLDRAVGMALFPKDTHTLVWAGEVGEHTTGNRTAPHMRRLLKRNRHHKTAGLFDDPRPMNIDPLIILQSDAIAVFDLPNPKDRQRIAEVIGFDPQRFNAACEETFAPGQEFWHLLWMKNDRRTIHVCPPLPT